VSRELCTTVNSCPPLMMRALGLKPLSRFFRSNSLHVCVCRRRFICSWAFSCLSIRTSVGLIALKRGGRPSLPPEAGACLLGIPTVAYSCFVKQTEDRRREKGQGAYNTPRDSTQQECGPRKIHVVTDWTVERSKTQSTEHSW